ncbi:MAG: ATP-binding cassette domain-containing protein [Clostridia bacterium]|nr:ATP-binding cassette domain-containing protein [Clostridia bacterium]
MIEVRDLSYNYKNKEKVLEDINLRIDEGEVVSVIGKNGSGKSTLARLIAGIIKQTKRRNFS